MSRFTLCLVLFSMLSCRTDPLAKDTGFDSGSPETGESAAPGLDADGDGFTAEDDCDDEDPSINPGAEELCNGLDDDCDGLVDDDDPGIEPSNQTNWYRDSDNDGFGNADDTVIACEAPAWYVEESALGFDCDDSDPAYYPGAEESDCTDPNDYNCDGSVAYEDADADGWAACLECNDADASIHPDAVEICDALDNDCDGDIDDADDTLDSSTASDWYADTDADGFGDPDVSELLCDMPSGYVADNTDCDDAKSTTYPGADEYCDGVDTDCDGTLDEDDALDALTWYVDSDNDTYGDTATTYAACTQPSGYVADDTDCDDAKSTTYPGADEYCDGVDSDCDGTLDEDDALDVATWYADTDSDTYGDPAVTDIDCSQPTGYVADNTDCDDSTNTVSPAATEYCNSVDDNCDGTVDEDSAADAATWYADSDTDTYGDPATSYAACSQPTGYVADNTDCDDTKIGTYPGADEYCDGVDTDCDGTVDEDDALDALTWYSDTDNDTYGDPSSKQAACSQPTGYVADNTDCDDTTNTVSPAATEYCNSVDDNCDGTIDEDSAADATTWYADSDSDTYGDASVTTTACAQPTGYASVDTDCDDTDATVNPGASEACDGQDNDCDGTVDSSSVCPCAVRYNGDNTHPYLFCTSSKSWNSARSDCQTYGYDLASLTTNAENLWVDTTADTFSTDKWHMGFTDQWSEGTWVWSNGDPTSYTNWHSAEPNGGTSESCAQINRYHPTRTWNDEPCGQSLRYVCEVD
jgi:hypothetical protein